MTPASKGLWGFLKVCSRSRKVQKTLKNKLIRWFLGTSSAERDCLKSPLLYQLSYALGSLLNGASEPSLANHREIAEIVEGRSRLPSLSGFDNSSITPAIVAPAHVETWIVSDRKARRELLIEIDAETGTLTY